MEMGFSSLGRAPPPQRLPAGWVQPLVAGRREGRHKGGDGGWEAGRESHTEKGRKGARGWFAVRRVGEERKPASSELSSRLPSLVQSGSLRAYYVRSPAWALMELIDAANPALEALTHLQWAESWHPPEFKSTRDLEKRPCLEIASLGM